MKQSLIAYFLQHRREFALIVFGIGLITGLQFLNGIYTDYKETTQLLPSLDTLIATGLTLICTGVVFCGYFLFNAHLRKQPRYTHNLTTHTTTLVTITGFLCVLTISFLAFLHDQPSAFSWPAIDMGPYLERQTNQDFVRNDFFTNASNEPNPRHIFGSFIVTLTEVFQTDWYTVFYSLFALFSLTILPLFFFVITSAVQKRLPDRRRFSLAVILTTLFTATVFFDKIPVFFSIGWWLPFTFGPMAQTLSLFLGLLFTWLALTITDVRSYRLLPLLFLATLVHPAIGLFVYLFFIVVDGQIERYRFYLTALCLGVGGAFATLAVLFPTQTNLNATDFIYHYIVESHSFHYQVSELASFTVIPWFISFTVIACGFIGAHIFGWYYKDTYLRTVTAFSFLFYTGAVAVQYIFIEIIPLKIVAIIGPVRFSQFGFWLLLFIATYTIAKYFPSKLVPAIPNLHFPSVRIAVSISLVLFICFYQIATSLQDDPKQLFETTYPGLSVWIAAETSPDDVFAVPPDFPPTHVPLLLNRPVFFGNGFPFTETGFIEHTDRKALLYGLVADTKTLPSQQPWTESVSFYRNLKPADFVEMEKSFPLDYVIIEKNHLDPFDSYTPIFQNEKILVYPVTAFDTSSN